MRSVGLIFILLCVALSAIAQQTYSGPQVIGDRPGHQIFIGGQKEGPYTIDGPGGTFQHSPERGEHVYTDAQGNTYVNRKNAGGGAGKHSIIGPSYTASRGGQAEDERYGSRNYASRRAAYENRRNLRRASRRGDVAQRDRRSPQLRSDRRYPDYRGNSFRYPNGQLESQSYLSK